MKSFPKHCDKRTIAARCDQFAPLALPIRRGAGRAIGCSRTDPIMGGVDEYQAGYDVRCDGKLFTLWQWKEAW